MAHSAAFKANTGRTSTGTPAGTSTPANANHRVERSEIARRTASGESAPVAFLSGANSSSRRALTAAYVNTGFDNDPALALYEDLGFVRLDDQLTIVERTLPR